ncbi:hypothetical protein [Neotabrizicola shimadae]|uniref:Uncharacterized protein n=1 Tax=Neotabrizicola shimadae TaxID=2807096 RepID=A0A8G1EBW4_9RHOB|nr:hypothetical protein [Neotabrizicola shimadae]QYZ70045.1 hypothetical protein JO391_00420 [Neotabrizicola shimadae]
MTFRTGSIASLQNANLAKGESLLGRAHSMADERQIGCLEAVAVDESGRCWVLGWVKRSAGNAFGALMLDRWKHPCAMAIARFSRDDVPSDATGFIGLLHGEWQPEIDAKLVVMLLAVEGVPHLRSVGATLRRVDMRSIATILDAAGSTLQDGYYRELRSILIAPESWVPGLSKAARIDVRTGVDNIVAIPGVGCIIEGWLLAPGRTTTGFALRAGDTVAQADLRSSFRLARPDLLAAFPKAGGEVQDAGFVAFFPMRDTRALIEELTLKLYHGENAATNHRLADIPIQWLNRGAGEDVLLRCYPSLEHEAFFPALAASLKRARQSQQPPPVGWQIEPSERSLFIAVSGSQSDAYRVADQVMDVADLLEAGRIRVVLMAHEAVRSHVLPLFRDLEDGAQQGNSLFFLRAALGLRDVAVASTLTKADRLVVLREDARMTRTLVEQCVERLSGKDEGLAVIAAQDRPMRQDGPPGLFWTARSLTDFARSGADWAGLPDAPILGRVGRSALQQPRPPLLARLERTGAAS